MRADRKEQEKGREKDARLKNSINGNTKQQHSRKQQENDMTAQSHRTEQDKKYQ